MDVLVFRGVSPGSVSGSHAMAWETLRLYLPPVESRHLGGTETCRRTSRRFNLTTWPLFGGQSRFWWKKIEVHQFFCQNGNIMLNFTKSRQKGCTWRFFLSLRFYSQLYSLLRPATFRLKRVGTQRVCCAGWVPALFWNLCWIWMPEKR